jgi:hypothetical protein
MPPFTLADLEVPHLFFAIVMPDRRQAKNVPGLIVVVVRDRDGFEDASTFTTSEMIDGAVYRRGCTDFTVSMI